MNKEDLPPPAPVLDQVVITSFPDEPEDLVQARAHVAALRAALESAERDLDILLAELAVANERLPAPAWQGGPSFRLNNVENGSYRLVNDVVIYSEDAKVRLNGGSVASAVTGEMRSDPMQTHFWGDLQVEGESGAHYTVDIRIRREGDRVTTTMRNGPRTEQ